MLHLLPTLALVGVGLASLEAAPVSAAHKPVGRSPHEHHRHLAARARVESGLGAQEKKRGLIRRNANGSQCRVKGAAFSPSSSTTVSSSSVSSSSASSSSSSSSSSPSSSSSVATSTSTAAPTTTSTAAATTSTAEAVWVQVQSVVTTTQSNTAAATWAQPSSSTTPAAQSSAATYSSGGTSNGGWKNTGSKFGLAWPNGNWAASSDPNYIGNYVGSKSSWYYTWSPFGVGSGDSIGLEFVPMLWGPNQVGDWWAQQSSWPSTVKNVLFFNEPNQSGQSDIAAQDSVSYWMNNMVPVRKSRGVALGGAATTSASSGLQWIQDFQKYCTQYGNSAADCKMDFVPIHWYDTTPSNFQSYVSNFHQQTGLDIWITEYACQNFNGGAQCSDSDTWVLHQQMAAWFDSQDYIKRYAPFGVMQNMQGVNQDNALMNPDGTITSLGNWYIWSA